ncbi:MAG: T9SS type A sorting domain-containing protein [Lewinellaceae bacterium]|nr:T9SS type A sorting domain-containing protein [Lewinellaceae bacterium]
MTLRHALSLIGFAFMLPFLAHGQDTIVVQTFTWESGNRSGVFSFPDNPGQTYRKILMRYNMRCHDAAVGNGSVGCYEWDYSCNTFITDSTRVDSNTATHPSHIISNFSGTTFDYTTQPTFTYLQFAQSKVDYTNVLSESTATVGENTSPFSVENGAIVGKYQFLFTAAELQAAGLTAGPITGLRWYVETPDLPIHFLRVRMKASTKTELDPNDPDLDGFTSVYFLDTQLSAGANSLNFYQPFDWDGASNVLVEYSYTNPAGASASNLLEASDAGFTSTLANALPDNALRFAGAGDVEVPAEAFSNISNEITISVWTYGAPDILPVNTSLLEGTDDDNQRQVNVHLPWSNSNIYWDCGNDGSGYDRINKAASEADFEGKWNHWAFTKNAGTGEMKIYLNGQLWHSGTGKTKPINIKNFKLGSAVSGSPNYYGSIHDLCVWNKALDSATIQDWMNQPVTPLHPYYSNLQVYYPFDEGAGTIAHDAGPNGYDGTIEGFPAWQLIRGDELYKNFTATSQRPKTTFVQGEYEQEITEIVVLDSVENSLHSVVAFGVDGTDLITQGTEYLYLAGDMNIIDESGAVVGTVYVEPEGSIEITTLNYFAKSPAKFELLSLVTPYGNGLDLGEEGKSFFFDVSDYAPILKGNKRISIEMGGQNQEELDIQFWFISGTPEREVLDVQQIWPFRRGWYADIQNDVVFEPRELTFNPEGTAFKLRAAVTGHGQNGEFVPRTHYIDIDGGLQEFVFDVWKKCGENPIYPQGGTWLYDRAGWCPGAPTDIHELELSDFVTPGQTVTIDYGVNDVFMSEANYLVNAQLVTYGPYTHTLDASLEAIARPSKRVEYERINPACNTPLIYVKNAGTQYIQSMKIDYWVKGNGTVLTYSFSGVIAPGETTPIELPVPFVGFWKTDEEQVFYAAIKSVNGQSDDYADNDHMESAFDLPLVLDDQLDLMLEIRTNNRANENFYTIRDQSGAIVASRYNMSNNTTYQDDINFAPGCYTLFFEDLEDDGLSYWADPSAGAGWVKIRHIFNSVPLTIYSFISEFGGSLKFDFVVGAITPTDEVPETRIFSIYPNPAYQEAIVELTGFEGGPVQIELIDLMGRKLWSQTKEAPSDFYKETIDLQSFPTGLYFVRVQHRNKVWVKEVVKSGG